MRHFEGYARRYGVALASQFEFPQMVAEAGVEEGSLAQGERSELLLACGERARQPASNLFPSLHRLGTLQSALQANVQINDN